MSELKDILDRKRAEREHKAGGSSRPKAPSPDDLSISFEKGEAEFVARPGERPQEALDRLVREMWGEDAPLELLEIKEVTFWGDPDDPFKRFKAGIREPAVALTVSAERVARIREQIGARPPRRVLEPVGVESMDLVFPADAQLGKAHELFGGTPETVTRFKHWEGMLQDRRRDAKKSGDAPDDVAFIGMGDTTEGCGDNPNYQTQDFTVDLNQADQVEVATELHDSMLDTLAGDYSRVITSVMASNHDVSGGTRGNRSGRADNRAFTVWRTLARAYGKNPDRYGHVSFWLPQDPNVLTFDAHGIGVAAIHGDLPRKGGATPQQKMWHWWKGQIANSSPVNELPAGACRILVTGHYHHKWDIQQGQRWLFGCPSADGGSGWLTDSEGTWSPPGLLVMTVDKYGPRNVDVLPDPAFQQALQAGA